MTDFETRAANNAAERRVLFSDPMHTGAHYVRRATGMSLSLIEKLIASHIRVEGAERVPAEGPVLFLCNHFTRFETFILPWLLDRHTKRFVHNLAHHALFHGRFGDYLRAIGARSTKEHGIKDAITADLITGHHDWIIYPEGSMIKDKHVWHDNKFELDTPDRHGPPHTGSALMALQAALVRQQYLDAWRKQDSVALDDLEERWHFTGANLPRSPLRIVPITITYYPIRPGDNVMGRLARRLLKQVPTQLEEELSIEGNLLLGDTDISVYFGNPIDVEPWVAPVHAAFTACGNGTPGADAALVTAKDGLTNHVMGAIYRNVTVHFDHLFAAALRYATHDRIRCDDFHRAIYLAARTLQAGGRRRAHPSIGEGLLSLVSGGSYAPLDSVRALAERDGLLTIEGEWYVVNRQAVDAAHQFHDVRVKNTLAVIANELEPLREAVKAIREAMALPRARLHERVGTLLFHEDLAEFQRDYAQAELAPTTLLRSADIGRPFKLSPSDSAPKHPFGVIVCHGYMAAPAEVRELSEYLVAAGHHVYGARLSGHGTDPEQLAHTKRDDWRRSLERGIAAMRSACEQVVVVGFSTGGLLAIDAAARLPGIIGVVAINAPLHLRDRASLLAPAVDVWNGVAHALHLDRLALTSVSSDPEWPDVNYTRNPVSGLHELERLIRDVRMNAPLVQAPTLLLQSDEDPVVVPASAEELYGLLGSAEKSVQRLKLNHHVIVRGEGSQQVAGLITDFLAGLARHW